MLGDGIQRHRIGRSNLPTRAGPLISRSRFERRVESDSANSTVPKVSVAIFNP
jgi:hypothetical protein